MKKKQGKSDLIIPVYLNQRVVFDLLAMLQGGISTLTRVSSSESTANTDSQAYGTTFGVNQVLSTLLKIDLSASRDKKSEGKEEIKSDEERFHTPASLFYRLREIIKEKDEVIVIDEDCMPEAHQIVEFTASLKRNPLIQVMDTLVALTDMAIAFSAQNLSAGTIGLPDGSETLKKQPKREKTPNIQLVIEKLEDIEAKFLAEQREGQRYSEGERVKAQMELFSRELKSGNTVDIIAEQLKGQYKAVITLEQEFLTDPSMSDLVDGYFTVIGKITRVIPDESDSISLVRKTALNALPESIITGMLGELAKLGHEQGFRIPDMGWLDIKGPVIQVIPIAIFA